MILPILRDHDPLLKKRAARVTQFGTPYLEDLVANMWDTMHHAGGIGLAAPQVGHSIALFIYGGIEGLPAQVLVNPTVQSIGPELITMGEGCLSIPQLHCAITRPQKVFYTAWDIDHHYLEGNAEGLEARVILHENDHLKGVLLTDRLQDEKSLSQAL